MTARTDNGEIVEGDLHGAMYFRAKDGRVFYSWEVKIVDGE